MLSMEGKSSFFKQSKITSFFWKISMKLQQVNSFMLIYTFYIMQLKTVNEPVLHHIH